MAILINIILPVFIVAGIAALAQDRLKFSVDSFAKASFYVFSPAMVLVAFLTSDVSGQEFGQIALTYTLTTLALLFIGWLSSRILHLDTPTRAAFLAGTILPNTGNYGMPVTYFAFGDGGLARAALIVTSNSILRSSLGVYIAASGNTNSPWKAMKRMFTVPVVYAAAVGLVLNVLGWTLPEPVMKAAEILADGLVPGSLVVLGVQVLDTLRQRKQAISQPVALAWVSLLRLVAAPLVAWLMCALLGVDGLTRDVLILECATPTAVMSLVLATEFKTNVKFAAMAIFATTIASLLTVTIWLGILM